MVLRRQHITSFHCSNCLIQFNVLYTIVLFVGTINTKEISITEASHSKYIAIISLTFCIIPVATMVLADVLTYGIG